MRVGILLGGCGLYDGTDVHEAVLTQLALEKAGERPTMVAPAVLQDRTIDHLSGDESPGEIRDVLKESARLARGRIVSLSDCRPEDLQAIIVPGGYGPVVNFSTGFARPGQDRRTLPVIEAFLRHFLEAGKPVGLVGLGEITLRTLLGQELDPAPAPSDPRHVVLDLERRLVSTPGFVAFSRLQDVQAGIEAMVEAVLRMMEERPSRPSQGASAGKSV
jgi:enhancing lycopene biosynthesis protein 2